MAMTKSDVLRYALGKLTRRNKWCKGRVHSDGQRCIMGAITEASTRMNADADIVIDAAIAVVDALPAKARGRFFCKYLETPSDNRSRATRKAVMALHHWNDAPSTTHADVVNALQAAYEMALLEESLGPLPLGGVQ